MSVCSSGLSSIAYACLQLAAYKSLLSVVFSVIPVRSKCPMNYGDGVLQTGDSGRQGEMLCHVNSICFGRLFYKAERVKFGERERERERD